MITSYLAANAVVIPATGWLVGAVRAQAVLPDLLPRCSWSARSCPARAPDLDHADRRAHLPGPRRRADHSALAGDPLGDLPVPSARPGDGGVGRRLHPRPDPGPDRAAATWPTSGRGAGSSTSTCRSASSASSWPARSCSTRRICGNAGRIDWWGLGLMVAGFGCLQLVLDRGEREDWFDSPAIVALAIDRRHARSSAS